MVGQLSSGVAAGGVELEVERARVNADAHRGDLHRAAERLVPEQQVAVEGPVVIVRRAAVVRLAGAQRRADADDEGRRVLAHIGVLALFRRKARVHVLELLRGDEAHAARELSESLELRIDGLHGVLRVADRGHDVHDRGLEVVEVAVFGQDDLLPVPLVDVDGVESVELVLVAAHGVHVGDDALAGIEAVALEREALPLGEGLHDLGAVGRAQDIEADRALIAVEVVVQARGLVDEERRGDALEVQQRAEPVLKQPFEQADGLLRVVNGQIADVAFRDRVFHVDHFPSSHRISTIR